MGFFSDIAGSVVGGLIGGFGDKKASGQLDAAALQAAGLTPQLRNFPTRTLFGTNRGGQAGVITPGYQGQEIGKDLHFMRVATGNQFKNFNRPDFAQRFFDAIDKLESRREAQAFNNFESALFNKAGVHTGTQRQVADFQNDINDARFRRGLKAELASYDVSRDLFGRWRGSLDQANAFQQAQLNQIDTAIGGETAPLGINQSAAQQGLLGAGGFRARNTQNFFDSLGGIVGGGVQSAFAGGFGGGGGGGGGGEFTQSPFLNRQAFNNAGGNIFG